MGGGIFIALWAFSFEQEADATIVAVYERPDRELLYSREEDE